LHYALSDDDIGIIRQLLEAGADPSLKDNEGFDAFAYAKLSGDERIINLVQGGAKED